MSEYYFKGDQYDHNVIITCRFPTFHRANTLYDYVIRGKAVANLRCKGTEKDITDCLSGHLWNESTCDDPYYVGVNCGMYKNLLNVLNQT